MFTAALNPLVWSGLALVSVPIIIHLINRLRYRRVRWAAMEFLLKSQQRNRRKLILEQLLLLFLRCLLVACVVALIARPTWFLGDAGRTADWPTHHCILLDDSLSMRDLVDAGTPEGTTAFRTGTKLLADLAQFQADSGGTHYWTVLRWTDPTQPEVGRPLPAESVGQTGADVGPLGQLISASDVTALKDRLEGLRESWLPASPEPALRQAARYLQAVDRGHRVLHLVSDFRAVDWLTSQADASNEVLAELARLGVRVRFHDVARPARGPNQAETPPAHGNLGLVNVQVKPRRRGDAASDATSDRWLDQPLRIVTPRLPFDVEAVARNFSEGERRQLRLSVSVDGVERASRILDRLPGGGETAVAFNLEFGPEEPLGLKTITVRLDDAEQRDHLPVDNQRHAYVELRREIPVLIVDGNLRGEEPSDAFFLSSALTATTRTGVRVERISPRDVARRADLANYPVIYLVDVAGVGRGEADLEPEGVAALEDFVRGGGSLFITLGPRTNVTSWNDQIHRQGDGLLPVPLMPRPDPDGRSTQSFIDELPDERDLAPKFRFEAPGHPTLPFEGDLADLISRYLLVHRYYRVPPTWEPPPGTQVLLRLANRRPLSLYASEVSELAGDLLNRTGTDADRLRQRVQEVRKVLTEAEEGTRQKGPLLDALSSLRGDPALASFWEREADLRTRLERLMKVLSDGDPLLLEAHMGKGRIMTLVTPAAPTSIRGREYSWNNLASGDLGEFFFVPFVLSTQTYLAAQANASGDRTSGHLVGATAEIELDRVRFQPEIEVWYQKDDRAAPERVNLVTAEAAEIPDRPGVKGQVWRARMGASRGPGIYRLRLNQPKASSEPVESGEISLDPNQATLKAPPEERALVFNLDNRKEGDLNRAAEADVRTKLAQALHRGPAKVAQSEAQAFVDARSWFVLDPLDDSAAVVVKSFSWSDYSWVLFAMLGLLLLEQTLARRFSHLQ